ncbi:FtsX-like permease family protein [compost metagenome]
MIGSDSSSNGNVKDGSVFEDELGAKLTALEDVALISFSSGVGKGFKDMLDSMNIVMVVLIVSAAALAFVVLYNLTNINVSERVRELSTIKVLGFYDKEVTMYIYRENLILTFMGVVVGNFAGILLHQFVLRTAEIDIMMFSPTINWLSYVYASLLTLLFSGIVMLSMHYKLKHIDMIEALKSVE